MSKTPKLRFKEFSGEWEIKKMGDLADVCTGKKDTQDKVDNGMYPFFVRSQTIERINSYSFDGEAILTAGDGAGVGKVFHYLNGKFDYHQRVYKLSDFKDGTNGRYIYEYFKLNFIREVTKYTAKTSVDSVRMEMITKMNIPVPPKEEQEKIASFFSLIDDKILLQSDKVEALKDYKKGMMQKIFSREFRFIGFNNNWKVSKAKDLFDSISDKNHNGDLEVLSATQDKGVIPRSELDIDIKFEKGNLKSYKKVNKSDFIISLRSFQGGIEHSKHTGLVSPAYTVFNFKDGIDFNHDFFAIIFKRRDFINRLNTLTYGIRDGKAISFKDFSDVKLEYPEIEEQNKIAEFFSIVDKKIKKEQKKLDLLNEYKKGLLQQMFV